jgi:hypothetical protein
LNVRNNISNINAYFLVSLYFEWWKMSYIIGIVNKKSGSLLGRDESPPSTLTLDSFPFILTDDLKVQKTTPSLHLIGTKTFQLKEDTGKYVVRNVTDGVDEVVVDPATRVTLYRNLTAGGIALDAHASRHAYGGADALGAGSLDRSQLKPLGFHWVKTASPTPGTGGVYGTAVNLTPAANKSVVLLSASLTWGGTFGTGETVTIRITVTFSDATTASITKSATATGTVLLNPADLQGLMKDGVYVNKVSVDSTSSLTSTTVTTSATLYGIEI